MSRAKSQLLSSGSRGQNHSESSAPVRSRQNARVSRPGTCSDMQSLSNRVSHLSDLPHIPHVSSQSLSRQASAALKRPPPMGLGCSKRQPLRPPGGSQGEQPLQSVGPTRTEALEITSSAALGAWRRFLRSLRQIRRLQRLFHCTGIALQGTSETIREHFRDGGHWHVL